MLMLGFLVIALLIAAVLFYKSKPLVTAVIDLVVAVILIFMKVVPGKAGPLDYLIIIVLFIGSAYFFNVYRRSRED